MFKTQNFCHIASNNRNQVKVGVFVYRTTDDLATVLTSGYFNDRIIDINLHDLIIHEKVDSADATKVEHNLLCVTERTLENVKTSIIKSKWEEDIEQTIEGLGDNFVKTDGSSVMTAPLKFKAGSMRGAIAPYLNGVSFWKMDSEGNITNIANLTDSQFLPVTTNSIDLGNTTHTWKDAYISRVITAVINNGYDIAVPVTNSADTLALKSQVDDAANSGEQLYNTGVWYAKMYSATVVPTGAEYDGRNYADFSQVDNDNNPIVVIYTGVSGAWTETTRITPPANHVGYITVTSKIWDIAEQTNQQGGEVLWSYNQKTFTPYPRIVSISGCANIDLSNLTSTGKANISTQGTYDANETYGAGTVGEAITSKVTKGHEVIASQEPSVQNDYTWYRKYADGWVEQGQSRTVTECNNADSFLITLPVTMADTCYSVNAFCAHPYNGSTPFGAPSTVDGRAISETQIRVGQWNSASASMELGWEVKGKAAS